jgi:hypothetical protein
VGGSPGVPTRSNWRDCRMTILLDLASMWACVMQAWVSRWKAMIRTYADGGG